VWKGKIISSTSAWIIRECGKVNIIFYTSAWISGNISRVWKSKNYILDFSMDYKGTFQECGKYF
jgi:hypothetical protein